MYKMNLYLLNLNPQKIFSFSCRSLSPKKGASHRGVYNNERRVDDDRVGDGRWHVTHTREYTPP